MRRDNSQNGIIPHFFPFCKRYTDTHRHTHACTESYVPQAASKFSSLASPQPEGETLVPRWAEATCGRQRGMFCATALREVDLLRGLSSPAGPFQCNGKTQLRNSFCPLEVRAMLWGSHILYAFQWNISPIYCALRVPTSLILPACCRISCPTTLWAWPSCSAWSVIHRETVWNGKEATAGFFPQRHRSKVRIPHCCSFQIWNFSLMISNNWKSTITVGGERLALLGHP